MTGGTIYSKAIIVAFATCAGFGGAEAKECHRTEMRTNYVLVALPSAVKLVGRDAPIAPQSPTLTTEYAYQYDDIGNRLTSLDLGTNRTYSANNLNQYMLISNLCDSQMLAHLSGSATPNLPSEAELLRCISPLRETFIPQFDGGSGGSRMGIKTNEKHKQP